jgi:hypothetical protein
VFSKDRYNTQKYIFTNKSCDFLQKVAGYLINNFRYLDAKNDSRKKYGFLTHLMYYFKYLNIHDKILTISITEDREFDVYARLSISIPL